MPAFSRFLRYFVAVGRCGSIRRAGEELNVSASAIDRQILQAEAELNVALFERLPQGLRLTAAGEIMMAAAGDWHRQFAVMRDRMDDLRGLRRGQVRIAVVDAVAEGHLPRLIGRLSEHYPGISVTIRILGNRGVRDAIAAGDVDFGIFLDPQSFRDLAVRAHCEVPLGFVTKPDDPLAKAASHRFTACAGRRMVLPAEPLVVAEQVALLQGATGLTLDAAASSDNILMVKALVADGLGVGILTAIDVMAEVERGTLAFVPIAEPILRPMTLALCVASSRTLSSAATVLLSEVEASFAQFGMVPVPDLQPLD